MSVKDWSTTASDNGSIDADEGINAAEGVAPGQLNDNDRAIMAAIKSWYNTGKAAFRAHKNSTNQGGVASGVVTKVTFPTEVLDIGSYYDAGSSRWTPPAGPVMIQAAILLTSGIADNANIQAHIYKNGASFVSEQRLIAGTNGMVAGVSLVDNASGTDYYEAYFLGGTGSTMTLSGSSSSTYFQGFSI